MRKFGLIGFPLTHSFSPNYFAKKFEVEGIHDAKYELFPLEDISNFPDLLQAIGPWNGLNVTIPHKESILAFIDDLTPEAKAIGAVNCLKPTPRGIIGHNTDYIGFIDSIRPLLKAHDKKALILGTGGASKAVLYGLNSLGIDCTFVSRSEPNTTRYTELNEIIMEEHSILVNTTPLGTFPNVESCPAVPFEYINSNHLIYDLVYNPSVTTLMTRGLDKGARVVNGLNMLHIQAEKAWQFWMD